MLPAQRTCKSRKLRRRSHHAIKPMNLAVCPNCGSARQPHAACPSCGYVRKGLQLQQTTSKDE